MADQSTVFVTGGHVTPAIAVIEEIRTRKFPWRIVFVGRKSALEGEKMVSAEYVQITKMDIPFLPLVAGRFTRVLTPLSFLSLLKIPLGFFQAFWYVASYRPKLVISFGGYVAVPVVLAAVLFGIPVVTHEQTIRLGLANRIIGFFARKIFLSFPIDSSQKMIVTGLPVRQVLLHPPEKSSMNVPKNKPVLYITGGSTGAASMNEHLFPLIKTLLATWCVIHQTGQQSYGSAQIFRSSLSRQLHDYYFISPYFQSSDVAWIYKQSDLIISRAGANTVWELAALGKIAILVPLPWSAGGEQLKNARWLAAKGTAFILDQKDVSAERFMQVLDDVGKHRSELLFVAKKLSRDIPIDGAKRIVDEIATMIIT